MPAPPEFTRARPDQASSCQHKEQYPSPQKARAQAQRLQKRKRGGRQRRSGNSRGVPRVYKCDYCSFWHVGSGSY